MSSSNFFWSNHDSKNGFRPCIWESLILGVRQAHLFSKKEGLGALSYGTPILRHSHFHIVFVNFPVLIISLWISPKFWLILIAQLSNEIGGYITLPFSSYQNLIPTRWSLQLHSIILVFLRKIIIFPMVSYGFSTVCMVSPGNYHIFPPSKQRK